MKWNTTIHLSLALLFCLTIEFNAQDKPDPIKQIAYPYLMPEDIGGKSRKQAVLYSLLGKYEKSLELWDEDGGNPSKELSSRDIASLDKYQAKDAQEYIAKEAEKNRIVIINEHNHSPLHRSFTTSMLWALKQQGYQYFAAVGFTENIDSLNNRGHFIAKSGNSFFVEPMYADLIRKAMQIGFEIIPLPVNSRSKLPDDRSMELVRSIHMVFRKNKDAKVVIHANFSDVMEHPPGTWKGTMATYLKTLTNSDPLTIDQVSMSERSVEDYENPYYRFVEPDLKGKSKVLIDGHGRAFVEPKREKWFDIQVFHPRTVYENNRPTWIKIFNKRESFNVDFKRFFCEFISLFSSAFAYKDKGEGLIPVDQIYVDSAPYYDSSAGKTINKTSLYLSSGRYRIVISSPNGDVVFENSVTIK